MCLKKRLRLTGTKRNAARPLYFSCRHFKTGHEAFEPKGTAIFRDVWVHCKSKLQCTDVVVFKLMVIHAQILFTFYNGIC